MNKYDLIFGLKLFGILALVTLIFESTLADVWPYILVIVAISIVIVGASLVSFKIAKIMQSIINERKEL